MAGELTSEYQNDAAIMDIVQYKRHKPMIWKWMKNHNKLLVSQMLDTNNQLQLPTMTEIDADAASDVRQNITRVYKTMKNINFAKFRRENLETEPCKLMSRLRLRSLKCATNAMTGSGASRDIAVAGG